MFHKRQVSMKGITAYQKSKEDAHKQATEFATRSWPYGKTLGVSQQEGAPWSIESKVSTQPLLQLAPSVERYRNLKIGAHQAILTVPWFTSSTNRRCTKIFALTSIHCKSQVAANHLAIPLLMWWAERYSLATTNTASLYVPMYWLCLQDNVVVIGLSPLGVNPAAASKDTTQCHSQPSRLDSQGTQTQDQLFPMYITYIKATIFLENT